MDTKPYNSQLLVDAKTLQSNIYQQILLQLQVVYR